MMKVLIIEDDPQIVESISLIFQIYWPEIQLISTYLGEEGVRLAWYKDPDFMILDLGLPDISGFVVIEKIRRFSIVPIIILTARGEEKDVIRGLELGADDYIVKPFKPREILARVKKVIDRSYVGQNQNNERNRLTKSR